MTWATIPQVASKPASGGTVRVSIARFGTTWKFTVALPAEVMQAVGAAHDTPFSLDVGEAEHLGWVRLRPDPEGVMRLGRLPGAAGKTGGGRLMMHAAPGMRDAPHPRAAADAWKVEDGALLVQLPAAWGFGPTPKPAPYKMAAGVPVQAGPGAGVPITRQARV
jgi:hypothetical protein